MKTVLKIFSVELYNLKLHYSCNTLLVDLNIDINKSIIKIDFHFLKKGNDLILSALCRSSVENNQDTFKWDSYINFQIQNIIRVFSFFFISMKYTFNFQNNYKNTYS